MVMVVAVMPGADAVSAPLVLPDPDPLPPELQALTTRARAATAARAGRPARWDLFIVSLLPGVRRLEHEAGELGRAARGGRARAGGRPGAGPAGAGHPGSRWGRRACR